LQHGVRYLSIAAVIIASTLLFFVLLHDDTKFLLNLQVQTVGYYFQTSIFQHMFWTDAFGQLREGSGRAIDGRAADQDWMEYVIPRDYRLYTARICLSNPPLQVVAKLYHGVVVRICARAGV
jgi:BCCT, betaine/carnitine/choline family transporter